MALTDSQKRQKEKQMEYWKDRETEQLKHYITEEAEYQKQIEGIYNYMMNQIQKEISQFYAKYAVKEGITLAEAKKRVSKLDIEEYGRKAKKYVKEKDFSDQANEEMRLYNATMKINRLELLKANIGLELVDGFNDLQKYFDTILTERTLEEFERQAGILGKSIQDNAQAAYAVVNASFANAKFSDRIWMYQDLMKAELSGLLQVGLIQGRNPKALSGELVKKFDVSRRNAERLMRTELARVQTEAQKQSLERNGYEEYQFHALGTACGICKDLDGKHFKIKDMEIAVNAPPCHPNCRCSTSAYMDREEFEKWLEERDSMLHTYEDPIREKIGSAFESHPKEVEELIKNLQSKGIEIEYRKGTMGYMPSPVPGAPGKMVIDKEASYSAWLHENQHVTDDELSGWKGFRLFMNSEKAALIEDKAYDIEIDFAKELGYNDVVKELEVLKSKRHKEVIG